MSVVDAPCEEDIVTLPDGRRVGMARYGCSDGHPVLAFHGAPASRLMYDVAHASAKDLGLTLICPDRPGYGLTPPDQSLNLAARTRDHLIFAETLGLKRFAVIGISGGGPYATALAHRAPEAVVRLALVSPIGPVADFDPAHQGAHDGSPRRAARVHMHPFQRWFFLKLPRRNRLLRTQSLLASRAFKAAPELFASAFARSLGRADREVLGKPHNRASLIRMTQEALRQGVEGGVADLKIFSRPWGVDFASIKVPAVVWQGTRDRIVPPSAAFVLGEALGNARIERLKGAGHFWVYDHIDEVLSFVAGRDG